MRMNDNKGEAMKVISRDGKEKGRLTGGERVCQLEGCTGNRVGVRWEDGTLTFPCTKGMKYLKNGDLKIV